MILDIDTSPNKCDSNTTNLSRCHTPVCVCFVEYSTVTQPEIVAKWTPKSSPMAWTPRAGVSATRLYRDVFDDDDDDDDDRWGKRFMRLLESESQLSVQRRICTCYFHLLRRSSRAALIGGKFSAFTRAGHTFISVSSQCEVIRIRRSTRDHMGHCNSKNVTLEDK